MNAIYEPTFLNSVHGSRPNRGTHTALKDLKSKFQGVKWCVEGDIERNFPCINHKILLKLLSQRIQCSKFLSILKKCLKAGFKENNKFVESTKGLFEGNVTSPILNNIYLHQFDLFIEAEAKSFFKGKNRAKSSKFRRLTYQIEKAVAVGDTAKLKKLRNERWQTPSKNPFDPNFKRLHYVRYVDDFVVGVIGSRKDTVVICNKIKSFLSRELDLNLNLKKTAITHFSKNPISFLGTDIKGT